MTTESGWKEETQGASANADEWAEVESEAKIDLENEGEGFIGRFMGMDPPNANGIVQAHFENVEDLASNYLAERALINASRDLANKLRAVPHRSLVRAQWVSSMDTGQRTPMRVFRVQWK